MSPKYAQSIYCRFPTRSSGMTFYSRKIYKNSDFRESWFSRKMLTGAIRESLFQKFRDFFTSRKFVPWKFLPLKCLFLRNLKNWKIIHGGVHFEHNSLLIMLEMYSTVFDFWRICSISQEQILNYQELFKKYAEPVFLHTDASLFEFRTYIRNHILRISKVYGTTFSLDQCKLIQSHVSAYCLICSFSFLIFPDINVPVLQIFILYAQLYFVVQTIDSLKRTRTH